MKREEFLQSLGLLALAPTAMKLSDLEKIVGNFKSTDTMPVFFAGHGNPMNAIEDNSFTKGWKDMVKDIPTPKAILCISAHWETNGTSVTAMPKPRTIHDFYGFPQALFDMQYPSPGTPEFASLLKEMVTRTEVQLDYDWGLDHGTWSVLAQMFPSAEIPVFQLSLDRRQKPQFHYDLGEQLSMLREKGVLIIGSGNIVHNLSMADLRNESDPYDWAIEFDERSKKLINAREHILLTDYHKLGPAADLSIPTPEHYLPLLYTLGLQRKDEEVQFFNEEIAFRSGSMRSLKIG